MIEAHGRSAAREPWRDGMVGHPLSLALGEFASPDQLSSRLAAGPLSSKCHVLGRLQRSTYIQVRLALQAPSGVAGLGEGGSPRGGVGEGGPPTWPLRPPRLTPLPVGEGRGSGQPRPVLL